METFIAIWSVSLQCDAEECRELAGLLSPEEADRALRYRREEDRVRFIKRRATLRQILADSAGFAPSALEIAIAPGGKPFLANAPVPLFFNGSHSRDMALYAVCQDVEVGVDIEWMNPNVDFRGVAAASFTPGECEQLWQAARARKCGLFYRLWTAREARLKAMGLGLGASPKKVESHLHGASPLPVEELPVPAEYAAAVACKCPMRIEFHAWDHNSLALGNFLSARS